MSKSRVILLVTAPDSWSKGCDFRILAGTAGEFSSPVNFVCRLFYSVCATPVLPQWHIKDPGHSAKSAGGRLHLNTHTSFTHQSQSGLTMLLSSCGNLSGNKPTRNSSGNTRSQSSQLAEPLWTDPGLKSGINLHKLISTLKKKEKSAGGEWTVEHSPKILAREEKVAP